jgi:hypothetical protein
MKINHLLSENSLVDAVKQTPQQARQLVSAMQHDHTVPRQFRVELGPKPSNPAAAQAWTTKAAEAWAGKMEQLLATGLGGDLRRNNAVIRWLITAYTSGRANYEDITGEAIDRLKEHQLLLKKQLLEPRERNLDNIETVDELQAITYNHSDDLARVRDEEEIARHRREKQDIVLINTARFMVMVPLNYGACYTFNNSAGIKANFCTGSSGGLEWFNNYAPRGAIIMVLDKDNADDVNGKWQIHCATRQLVNAKQERRGDQSWNDAKFSQLFPGLMREIGEALVAHSDELAAAGYDASQERVQLAAKWPVSWASGEDQ